MSAVTHNLTGSSRIDQGSSFSIRLRLSSPTLDFTGSTSTAQIRKTYSDPDILASFSATNGSDITGFFVDLKLTPAQTSAIPVAPNSKGPTKKSTFYAYDVEIQLADLTKIRLIEGEVEISPEVTR